MYICRYMFVSSLLFAQVSEIKRIYLAHHHHPSPTPPPQSKKSTLGQKETPQIKSWLRACTVTNRLKCIVANEIDKTLYANQI